jgi:hypothetical protein
LTAGCWDDSCAEPCREGYSCYYGICLSRGFCPSDDRNVEDENPCIQRDETTDQCVERSEYSVCREGYSCECTELGSEGQCIQRTCLDISTL